VTGLLHVRRLRLDRREIPRIAKRGRSTDVTMSLMSFAASRRGHRTRGKEENAGGLTMEYMSYMSVTRAETCKKSDPRQWGANLLPEPRVSVDGRGVMVGREGPFYTCISVLMAGLASHKAIERTNWKGGILPSALTFSEVL